MRGSMFECGVGFLDCHSLSLFVLLVFMLLVGLLFVFLLLFGWFLLCGLGSIFQQLLIGCSYGGLLGFFTHRFNNIYSSEDSSNSLSGNGRSRDVFVFISHEFNSFNLDGWHGPILSVIK